jgi:hypothetical protein
MSGRPSNDGSASSSSTGSAIPADLVLALKAKCGLKLIGGRQPSGRLEGARIQLLRQRQHPVLHADAGAARPQRAAHTAHVGPAAERTAYRQPGRRRNLHRRLLRQHHRRDDRRLDVRQHLQRRLESGQLSAASGRQGRDPPTLSTRRLRGERRSSRRVGIEAPRSSSRLQLRCRCSCPQRRSVRRPFSGRSKLASRSGCRGQVGSVAQVLDKLGAAGGPRSGEDYGGPGGGGGAGRRLPGRYRSAAGAAVATDDPRFSGLTGARPGGPERSMRSSGVIWPTRALRRARRSRKDASKTRPRSFRSIRHPETLRPSREGREPRHGGRC